MSGDGKAGSHIARFKKVILSWLKFNGISLQLTVNISGENGTPTIASERVLGKYEIDKMGLNEISSDQFLQLLRDKLPGRMTENGSKQKLVPLSEIDKLLSEGYEFHAVLPKGKAIIKMSF